MYKIKITVLDSRSFYLLLILVLGVVIIGLFLPLMENDSAQHASMALQMALNDDFFNIYKGTEPYLDKPHLHFWLSGLSMKLFGGHPWAYRIPAVLITILGSFSIYKLSNLLYQQKLVSQVSVLMFLTSQAIILSLHDVRTDAALTGFTIFSIWQWVEYLEKKKYLNAILGGLALGLAFSTKGIIAIGVVGLALFFRVYYKKLWRWVVSPQVLFGILSFFIAISPVLYAYNNQFGNDGIRFILLGQGIDRFAGEQWGKASTNDYFFYFHTILWAFLPWGLLFYYALFYRIRRLFLKKHPVEIMTWATVLFFMLIMNFSQFKLPHYLNIVLPLASIATSAFVLEIERKKDLEWRQLILVTQYIIIFLGVGLLLLLAFYLFPVESVMAILGSIIIIILAIPIIRNEMNKTNKALLSSFFFSVLVGLYLNTTFYPELLQYQAGNTLKEIIKINRSVENGENIYKWEDKNTWSLNFALGKSVKKITLEEAKQKKSPFWVVTYTKTPQDFKNMGFKVEDEYYEPNFRITRLTKDFLNPKKRRQVASDTYLILLSNE